jgi:hypothetical protein
MGHYRQTSRRLRDLDLKDVKKACRLDRTVETDLNTSELRTSTEHGPVDQLLFQTLVPAYAKNSHPRPDVRQGCRQ